MARAPSLKPQLNQIRTWVGEGVTDIWIAHQLGATPAQIADFRRKQGLLRPDESPAPAKTRAPRAAKPKTERAPKAEPVAAAAEATTAADGDDATEGDGTAKRRRRGRRGGRGRSKARAQAIPATLEHDASGVVIRIDAAILESPAYREHWSEVMTGGITVTAEGIALAIAPAVDEPADDDASDDDASDAN